MDPSKVLEDKLREAACFGDDDAVHKLIDMGVNVNTQHEINGWTALHWASKRGHPKIVSYLLNKGADKMLLTKKGETAVTLSDNEDIIKMFGANSTNKPQQQQINDSPSSTGKNVIKEEKLPIIPNYITFPPLQYKVDLNALDHHSNTTDRSCATAPPSSTSSASSSRTNANGTPLIMKSTLAAHGQDDELVLKIRVANGSDPDFIEVELPMTELTYSRLLRLCCQELQVDPSQVIKLRKLPDTILRKDKDVSRLRNFQEIELVLINHGKLELANQAAVDTTKFTISPFPQSGNQNSNQLNRSHSFNHCKIFY
ncbi:hypothetical protein CHUAL_003152 [Chamberlinius hualienensis]